MANKQLPDQPTGLEIAIVGMSGRFPGAKDIDEFWGKIREGVESFTVLSNDALREEGVPSSDLNDAHYVKTAMRYEGMDLFDAGFFGFSPREASQLDPQQRHFLECAWAAVEHSGYDVQTWPGAVGVFAGAGANLYLMRHLLPKLALGPGTNIADLLSLLNGNSADSLATRVAYKLNLRGPALTVQTACSTSLTAVHLACQSLLSQECDMALAGGVWLNLLQEGGYRYQSGAILSPDGHCRAFDAKASGTVLGSGAGVVVLRRLSDAIRDGDTVHAVIKGSAVNNDGSHKVGYTAPSVEGQADVIRAAHALAEVSSDTIAYVEAHGTGTTLGDPIEVAALTKAFRSGTERTGYCALGSVKTNIGHLDAAAGVAGLIKTVLAVKHQTIPPSLHFVHPNPEIDFASSPFYVPVAARPWAAGAAPRRAGVSSFGMGGTNVHLVVEEAPPRGMSALEGPGRPLLLRLSARTETALVSMRERLAGHLEQQAVLSLPDVEYTLSVGRKRFGHRAVAIGRRRDELVDTLSTGAGTACVIGRVLSEAPTVAFMFPGQGAQHVDMGRALYACEPVFRSTVDECSELLKSPLGLDLREVLYPEEALRPQSDEQLRQTRLTQPALFVVEYAMARWWMSQGIVPEGMLGHSIGEYVAACLSGVFSLRDALALVAERGRLLQLAPQGAMLAVNLPEDRLTEFLQDGCDLAAVNAAELCVLSGPVEAIERAELTLSRRAVSARRLHVSHAFHSALIEPVLAEFTARLRKVELQAPTIPFISNLSGRWITSEEACSPEYWVAQMRGTVRFAQGVEQLLARPDRALLEVGPGETLTSLARRQPATGLDRPIIASQAHPGRLAQNPDQPAQCLARLWVAGIEANALPQGGHGRRRRVPLPSYPFERESYWGPAPEARAPETAEAVKQIPRGMDDWFYRPAWVQVDPALDALDGVYSGCTLILGGGNDFVEQLDGRLCKPDASVIRVKRGPGFAMLATNLYSLRPGEQGDYAQLLTAIAAKGVTVGRVCHLWSLDQTAGDNALAGLNPEVRDDTFFSLVSLARALDEGACLSQGNSVNVTVVTHGLVDIGGADPLCPAKALLFGPCQVIPQEYHGLNCRLIDILEPPHAASSALEQVVEHVAALVAEPLGNGLVALRGRRRWIRQHARLHHGAQSETRLRQGGVYLITGGFGGVGMALARHLATYWQARLVLLGRGPVSRYTDQIAELERLGATVLALAADVTDSASLRAAVAQGRAAFGSLHGVIHAAGESGGGLISLRSREAMDKVLAPKLDGTIALLKALEQDEPDFVLLCSSISSIAGGIGQVDYCAANAFLDAVAEKASRHGERFVLSVNWDTWRGVGMAAAQKLPDGVGITPEQGGQALEHLLSGPLEARIAVSAQDIERQIAQMQGMAIVDRLDANHAPTAKQHARPALQSPYAAPATELEEGLADLWARFLGITPVGVNDNLFELGGDSLLAVQLLAQVRQVYGVELHPSLLFRTPTVAALATLVETRLIEQIENAGDAHGQPGHTLAIA